MARADRVFGVLLLLALGSSAILIGLLGSLLAKVATLIERGSLGLTDMVTLALVSLATIGIALGIVTLARQLLATLWLIRSLLSKRVPLPPRLRAIARDLGLSGRVDLVDDARPFSFCFWFLRPRICLSTALVKRLDRAELHAVVAHERYHLRHRDPLRIVVARYFAAGLYVIPVVDDLVEYYTLEKEIEADHDAVRASGDVGPLARALYKLLPDADALSLGLLVPVGSLSVTEARIEQLVGGGPYPLVLRPASILLSGGALLAASALALLPGNAPASLLFAAALSGGRQQLKLVARAARRTG